MSHRQYPEDVPQAVDRDYTHSARCDQRHHTITINTSTLDYASAYPEKLIHHIEY